MCDVRTDRQRTLQSSDRAHKKTTANILHDGTLSMSNVTDKAVQIVVSL